MVCERAMLVFVQPSCMQRPGRDHALLQRLRNPEKRRLRSASDGKMLYSGAAICLIIPCSSGPTLSNNIIQKGLAFGRDWSGSVVNAGS